VKSLLQQWADVSVSTPDDSKPSQQRTVIEHLRWEPHLHRRKPNPISGRATQAGFSSLWRTVRLTGGMEGHALSTAHAASTAVGAAIENGIALAPRV
jgi:hypothetical protein